MGASGRFRDPVIPMHSENITVVKKRHTVKNNALIYMVCKIIFLTDTVEGKKHDKKLADETEYFLPDDSKLAQDTGFQGFKLANVAIYQPKKKPKGKEWTFVEKEQNRFETKCNPIGDWPMAEESVGTKEVISDAHTRVADNEMLKITFRRCHN